MTYSKRCLFERNLITVRLVKTIIVSSTNYINFMHTDVLSRNKTVVNCNMNSLARLNKDSCSDAVRAVANFFLDTDSTQFQDFCNDR